MKKRFSEEQIIGFLREAEAGVAIKDCAGAVASTNTGSRHCCTRVCPTAGGTDIINPGLS